MNRKDSEKLMKYVGERLDKEKLVVTIITNC